MPGEPEDLWSVAQGRTVERVLEAVVWEAALTLLTVDPRQPAQYLPTLARVPVPGAAHPRARFVAVLRTWTPPQRWPPWRSLRWPPATLFVHTVLVDLTTGAMRTRAIAALRRYCWGVVRNVPPPARRRGRPRRTTQREVREKIEAYLRAHPPEKGVYFWSAAAGHYTGLGYPTPDWTVTFADEKFRVSLRHQQQRLRTANQFRHIEKSRPQRDAPERDETKPAASPPPLSRAAAARRRTRHPRSK